MAEINETGLWTGGHFKNGNWSWLAGDYFSDKSIPKNHHKFLKFTYGALITERRKVQLPFACRKFDIKFSASERQLDLTSFSNKGSICKFQKFMMIFRNTFIRKVITC